MSVSNAMMCAMMVTYTSALVSGVSQRANYTFPMTIISSLFGRNAAENSAKPGIFGLRNLKWGIPGFSGTPSPHSQRGCKKTPPLKKGLFYSPSLQGFIETYIAGD